MGKNKQNKTRVKSEDIETALKLVDSGLSLYQASKQSTVPISTLWRRAKNHNLQKVGSKPHLSDEDEEILLGYAKFVANLGSPVTVNWILIMAGRLASKR